MKLTLGLFFIVISQMMATESYSQMTRISLHQKNAAVKEVLNKIEENSEFRFLYNSKLVNVDRTVTADFENQKIVDVLENLFQETDVVYTIVDRQIVLTNKAEQTNFSGLNGQQAGKTIKGKVTDASGAPLPGVTVVVKGKTIGSITDAVGSYSLSDISENSNLIFSFVGMKMQYVVVGNKTTINVVMEEETVGIEEVVAVGYGVVKKRDVTGSVASISSKEIGITPVSNSAQILQGKAAGVMVSSVSGSPGSSATVRIRGLGTVNNNDPLFVIDGIPSDGMNNINPEDIESVEILKDASASAIYGSRAANGVVLISTKKGLSGKSNISFETYVGVSTPWKNERQLNAEQYYNMIKTAHQNGGTVAPQALETEYKNGNSTNWWDAITREALTSNYYLSASGGTEKIRYAFSGGYFKQNGFVLGSDYSRISFRTKTDYIFSKNIKAGINLSVISNDRNSINEAKQLTGNGIIASSLTTDPMIPARDINSTDPNEFNQFVTSAITDGAGPLAAIVRNFNENNNFSFAGSGYLDLTLLRGLVFKTNFGINISNGNTFGFTPSYYLNPRQNNPQSLVNRGYSKGQGIVWENTLTYNTKIDENHSISTLLGVTAEDHPYEGFSGSKQGTPSNDEYFRTLNAAVSNDQITGFKGSSSLMSFLGRVNYSFKDKYLVTASIRRDGSSMFAQGHKWGVFPSVSLGWRLSEENFFKSLDATFIDNLKLRVGWGQIGNQNIASNAYLSLINGDTFKRYTFGDVVYQGYSPSNIGNPDVKWETVEQTNFATDINMFKNKLILGIDYYIKDTKDMLLRIPLVYYSGYPENPWANAGTVQNKGLEIQLTHRNTLSKDFSYEVGFNFSTVSNKVVSLGAGKPIMGGSVLNGNATKTEVGHPIGAFYGFVMDGIFQNDMEVANGHQPLAKPGDIRFKDIAGPIDAQGNPTGPDGKINENDKTYIGNPIPDYSLGVNVSLTYKSFDLSMFFQGVFGNEVYSDIKNYTHAMLGHYNVSQDAYNKAWKGEGSSNTQPRISSVDPNNNYRVSSFFVEDGSYLRLKNIQLGYTLPESVSKMVHLSRVRFFASGQNIFTLTKYSGLDPELGDSSPLMVGIDYGIYPQSRTLLGGISVNF